jgi:hypothetical protein
VAIISPPKQIINKLHQKAEEGELKVLNALETLPDDYEVYFQSYLNGDRPDFIISRKGGGVLLIEVKDWNLEAYKIKSNWNWELKANGTTIKSPFKQVYKVKQNLIDLHIHGLYELIRDYPKIKMCIKTCVIMTTVTTDQFRDFLFSFEVNSPDKYKNHVNYCYPLGFDKLNQEGVLELMNQTWIGRRSYYFKDEIYDLFKRHLKSPIHLKEEGIEIPYSSTQLTLMESSPVRRKIKGVAGCGKTVVLAGRVVNSALRTGGKVLVLTYNITLINYIKDRIRDVQKTFHFSSFDITNYHQWFIGEANNYNLEIKGLDSWEEEHFFREVQDRIKKYDAIFIDEVQDYHQAWLNMLTNYFLKKDGEFVVFGDEKQNIYDNPLDEQKNISITSVPGRWNRSLKKIYRFRGTLTKIAYEFQNLFGDKYNLDEDDSPPTLELDFSDRTLQYLDIDPTANSDDIVDIINYVFQEYDVHPGDATIMMSYIRNLRVLEQSFRTKMGEKTERTFASQEAFEEICKEFPEDHPQHHSELEKLNRREKVFFYAKSGLTKFSTIHSFKGWESDTIVLILDKNRGGYLGSEELIYTGLTRAKSNLFILNTGANKYKEFFEEFSNK